MSQQHKKPKVDPTQPRPKTHTHKNLAEPTGLFALPPATPDYVEKDGLRFVVPYQYAFNSWAKERWRGRELLEVYSEFRDRSEEYYAWAIKTGQIMINNRLSTADYIIKNGDLISNVLHRHEPPVVAGPIRIIYDGRLPGNDGQTLVIEKPGSMPVHATGRYNFNSLLEILKYDYNLPLVHTSNRLDRLTSGVMVCALTVEKSKDLGAWFGGRHGTPVNKEYVARAVGEFPEEEVICEEPLLTIDRQIGVNVVHPEGRDSKTIFKRMSYDPKSNTSVIHCRPITGRSHQIRVHLQFMGHPIANDPVYQNTAAWGEEQGKGGVFGKTRGGTEEKKLARKVAGDKLLAKELAKAATSEDAFTPQTESPADSEQEAPNPEASTSTPSPFNKFGKLKPGMTALTADNGDVAAQTAALTDEAKAAIAALREGKDAADGQARARDTKGIKLQIQREENAKRREQGEEVESEPEDEEDELGYCDVCFTPNVPDPKPEQLFIWLHAMRYHTTEWDYSSPLPYWAEPDYEVPSTDYLRPTVQ